MEVQIEKGTIYSKSFNYYDLQNKELRVAAYARVSTNSEDQISSINSQKKYYLNKINDNKKWILVDIFADEGISGTKAELRPQFIKMIKEANRGKIDLIITKSISRFARNTLDTLKYIKFLKERNIGIYFEEENIYTLNSSFDLVVTLLSSIAQQESINLSSHVKLGFKQKMERGEALGTVKCYGYDWDKKNKELIINNDQAIIVKRMVDMYMSGAGTCLIARKLTEEKIKTPSGKSQIWNEGIITKILKNEKICGDLILQKWYKKDIFEKQCIENVGQLDKYIVKNHHEGIITREQYDSLQKEINRRAAIRKPKNLTTYNVYPLTGKIKCGFCGETMIRFKTNKTNLKYVCSGKTVTNSSKICNTSKLIDDEIIKKAFMQTMKRLQKTIKNQNKYSNLINEKINYARTVLAKYSELDIDKFNEDLFKEIVRYIKIGEIIEDNIKYFTTRIVIKNEADFIIEDKIKRNEILSEDNKFILLDFYSNQTFHYYEIVNDTRKTKYVTRFRVIVEVNTNDY